MPVVCATCLDPHIILRVGPNQFPKRVGDLWPTPRPTPRQVPDVRARLYPGGEIALHLAPHALALSFQSTGLANEALRLRIRRDAGIITEPDCRKKSRKYSNAPRAAQCRPTLTW